MGFLFYLEQNTSAVPIQNSVMDNQSSPLLKHLNTAKNKNNEQHFNHRSR